MRRSTLKISSNTNGESRRRRKIYSSDPSVEPHFSLLILISINDYPEAELLCKVISDLGNAQLRKDRNVYSFKLKQVPGRLI